MTSFERDRVLESEDCKGPSHHLFPVGTEQFKKKKKPESCSPEIGQWGEEEVLVTLTQEAEYS